MIIPVMRRLDRILACIAITAMVVSCRSASTALMPETGFLDRTITLGTVTYPYAVYVPPQYDPGRTWPVVLFLHGAGERGHDGLRQTAVGIGSAIRWDRQRVPMIVVMLQVPDDGRWLDGPLNAAFLALDRSLAEFHGDPDRVILTGMSLGGYGTYALAYDHPDRFAALVPICGGILGHSTASSVIQLPATVGADDPYALVAQRIREIPVWIFHGADDPIIPVEEARRMSRALEHAGAAVRYTELPDTGHNAWDPAYGSAELWQWMAERSR